MTLHDDLSSGTLDAITTEYAVRDLWIKKDAGTTKKPLRATINGHDVMLIALTPMK